MVGEIGVLAKNAWQTMQKIQSTQGRKEARDLGKAGAA